MHRGHRYLSSTKNKMILEYILCSAAFVLLMLVTSFGMVQTRSTSTSCICSFICSSFALHMSLWLEQSLLPRVSTSQSHQQFVKGAIAAAMLMLYAVAMLQTCS